MNMMDEIGTDDINVEVLMLSSHMALPREWHVEAELQIMSYFRSKHIAWLDFDPYYL